MLKISKLFLLNLLFFPLFVFSQSVDVTLRGKVIEKDSGEPLEYATLVLKSISVPSQITGGITDMNGVFEVSVPKGSYRASIEYIGFKEFLIPQTVFNASLDLGTIALEISADQLDEIELVAEKTTVEVRLDKKVYNVGKDLTNSGATVSDALGNIPSVTVDVDGAIALRGNGNVRILINGRPSALAGFGGADALRQLPADAIEKVEVITSPSARYDAEGTAGILNIVLKKEKTRGFNGVFNASVGAPSLAGLSANVNLSKKAYNLFSTFGYRYSNPPGNGFFDNRFSSGDYDRIIEDRDIQRSNSGFNLNLGMEYFLTESSSIVGSVFARSNVGDDVTISDTERFISQVLDSKTIREEDEGEEEINYQFSLNYNNNFNDEGHKLTADLQYSFKDEAQPTNIIENNSFPNNNLIAEEIIDETEIQDEYLLQVDYVLPMGEAQFEAGYRGNWELSETSFRLDELNLETLAFEQNLGLTNEFLFDQYVNAFYTQYGNKFDKFSFLIGLRLENTRLKGQVEGVDVASLQEVLGQGIDLNFDKSYLGLFPTLNLIYELGENENITLGYNRRINRPRGYFINPFPSRASRTNVFQGNPSLDPAFANAYDIGYLKRWDKLTLTSSFYYQKETGSFERVQEATGQQTIDGIAIIRSIPINLSTNERSGAELGVLYNPEKWLRLNGSVNLFQFNTQGAFNGIDYSAKNTSWFSRFSSKVTLPANIDWQTNANYRGRTENAQTVNKGIFSIDLAFSKDILNDNGTLALNARDLLNSRKRRQFTNTPFFTSENEFQWRERQITLSFVYRVNQKKQRERAERNYDSEDYGG